MGLSIGLTQKVKDYTPQLVDAMKEGVRRRTVAAEKKKAKDDADTDKVLDEMVKASGALVHSKAQEEYDATIRRGKKDIDKALDSGASPRDLRNIMIGMTEQAKQVQHRSENYKEVDAATKDASQLVIKPVVDWVGSSKDYNTMPDPEDVVYGEALGYTFDPNSGTIALPGYKRRDLQTELNQYAATPEEKLAWQDPTFKTSANQVMRKDPKQAGYWQDAYTVTTAPQIMYDNLLDQKLNDREALANSMEEISLAIGKDKLYDLIHTRRDEMAQQKSAALGATSFADAGKSADGNSPFSGVKPNQDVTPDVTSVMKNIAKQYYMETHFEDWRNKNASAKELEEIHPTGSSSSSGGGPAKVDAIVAKQARLRPGALNAFKEAAKALKMDVSFLNGKDEKDIANAYYNESDPLHSKVVESIKALGKKPEDFFTSPHGIVIEASNEVLKLPSVKQYVAPANIYYNKKEDRWYMDTHKTAAVKGVTVNLLEKQDIPLTPEDVQVTMNYAAGHKSGSVAAGLNAWERTAAERGDPTFQEWVLRHQPGGTGVPASTTGTMSTGGSKKKVENKNNL